MKTFTGINRALAALLGLLMLCQAPASAASVFYDDTELRQNIDKLSGQLNDLSARVDKALASQREVNDRTTATEQDANNNIQSLRDELAKLRGQIEVLNNSITDAQKRQKDFYVDLDSRLRKLESPDTELANSATGTASNAAGPGTELGDYEAALNLFKAGKYADARAAFEKLTKSYPNSALLPSMNYWAAASAMQMKDYAHAAEIYALVAAKWPDDGKAAQALLGRADALAAAGDNKASQQTLQALINKYPKSDAAAAARSRLKSKKK